MLLLLVTLVCLAVLGGTRARTRRRLWWTKPIQEGAQSLGATELATEPVRHLLDA